MMPSQNLKSQEHKTRRANGDGSWKTRTRKDGSEYLEYRCCFGEDANGETIRKSFYGSTQKECRAKRKAFEKQLDNKQIVALEYTIGEWLPVFLSKYKAGEVSEATYENYEFNSKIILKHAIAKRLLTNIKPVHIREFFSDMDYYSDSVKDKLHILLYGAFESAIENDLCYKNPVKRGGRKKKSSMEKEHFNEYEIKCIEAYAPMDSFGWLMLLLLGTGMRSQELRALTWEKVQFDKQYVNVNLAVKREGKLGPPKGGRNRIIPIEPDLLQLLQKHAGQPGGYVLKGEGSHFATRDMLRHRFSSFINRLNEHLINEEQQPVRKLSPHHTRHTYATMLAKKGVSQKAIQLLLGHADLKTTDIYTHLDDLEYLCKSLSIKIEAPIAP